jgi:hypothetical protein
MKKILKIITLLLLITDVFGQTVYIDSTDYYEGIDRLEYLKKTKCYCEFVYAESQNFPEITLLIEEYTRLRMNNCNNFGGVYNAGDMIWLAEKLRHKLKKSSKQQIERIFGEPNSTNSNIWKYQVSSNGIYLILKFKKNRVTKTWWESHFD